jgi:hypothetical protein
MVLVDYKALKSHQGKRMKAHITKDVFMMIIGARQNSHLGSLWKGMKL